MSTAPETAVGEQQLSPSGEIDNATNIRFSERWIKKVGRQGPWNPSTDTGFSLLGAPSEPMPVTITETSEFTPFFTHLAKNGTNEPSSASSDVKSTEDSEPHYGTHMLEFDRGVLYKDHRMDLCKQVLGPTSLPQLMDSLETNTFVRHFLFGNNIIGPNAALRIAQYIQKHPDQIETWYLAGNCINTTAFAALVDGLKTSPAVTNVWLKRNPLGPDSVESVHELITKTPNLRTLDLDQTSLGDEGVSKLFTSLVSNGDPPKRLSLRHIYLNATGVGTKAATSIAAYLSSLNCSLESLYLSCNPLGSPGVTFLAAALRTNRSLKRLCLLSIGLTDPGGILLFQAAAKHKNLEVLDISHAYTTVDLGARYNWLTDEVVPSVCELIMTNPRLRYLDLGYTQLSAVGLNQVYSVIANDTSHRLEFFFCKPRDTESVSPPDRPTAKDNIQTAKLRKAVRARLQENVKLRYGAQMTYDEWFANEKRFLVSPRDVRFIDSVYRNRDARAAMRGEKRLKKWWDEGDDTLDNVMRAGEIEDDHRKDVELKEELLM